MTKLTNELTKALETNGWSMRELGRRADVSITLVSLVLSDQAPASADFCVKIADALGWSKEETLRLAGLLDPLPPAVADEREALALFRKLPALLRRAIIGCMRELQRVPTEELPHEPTPEWLKSVRHILDTMPLDELEGFAQDLLIAVERKREGERQKTVTL